MSSAEHTQNHASAKFYGVWFLEYIYDYLVLRLFNTFLWRCSTFDVLVPFFAAHLGPRHLDVGVGSGFYLAATDLSKSAVEKLVLFDMNQNSLDCSLNRINRNGHQINLNKSHIKVDCVRGDVFQAQTYLKNSTKFSSISLFYLLHCLPGNGFESKKKCIEQLAGLLEDQGVMYGATILGWSGPHNYGGRLMMGIFNYLGIFGNSRDTEQGLTSVLKASFGDVHVVRVGCVVLFQARNPLNK